VARGRLNQIDEAKTDLERVISVSKEGEASEAHKELRRLSTLSSSRESRSREKSWKEMVEGLFAGCLGAQENRTTNSSNIEMTRK
jgi:hypothetical protein